MSEMASKAHNCERPGWGVTAPSKRKQAKQREAGRHVLRSLLLADYRSEGGLPVFEFARFRRRYQAEMKRVRKEAAAYAMRAIPEPGDDHAA
jgi:hypothetical protein